MSTQVPLPDAVDVAGPAMSTEEPTLRDVLSAVTSCKIAITALTTQIKQVKIKVNLLWHDMQNLCDRTADLEGRMSNVED